MSNRDVRIILGYVGVAGVLLLWGMPLNSLPQP